MTAVPAVRREVHVDVPPDVAFRLFTEHLGEWWPLGDHSVFGDGTVAFEGDLLVERSGEQHSVWAEVAAWDPPGSLRLAWHPGADPADATDVEFAFRPAGGGTLVVVVHAGWERRPDPAAAAQEYGRGWPHVLARLAAHAAGTAHAASTADAAVAADAVAPSPPVPDRWFALVHRAGPSLSPGESVFAAPEFAEHLAFVGRLRSRGLLVAAGSLPDEDGAGMTIVRVRPEHGDVDVTALATIDDRCVAAGYLEVTVRPWNVMVDGG